MSVSKIEKPKRLTLLAVENPQFLENGLASSFEPLEIARFKSQKTQDKNEQDGTETPKMKNRKVTKELDEVHTPLVKERLVRDSSDISSTGTQVKQENKFEKAGTFSPNMNPKVNPLVGQLTEKSRQAVKKQDTNAESTIPEIKEEEEEQKNLDLGQRRAQLANRSPSMRYTKLKAKEQLEQKAEEIKPLKRQSETLEEQTSHSKVESEKKQDLAGENSSLNQMEEEEEEKKS